MIHLVSPCPTLDTSGGIWGYTRWDMGYTGWDMGIHSVGHGDSQGGIWGYTRWDM